MYKLFLDDERFPPRDGEEWVIARTVQEAKLVYLLKGPPKFVSFDHDLGEDQQTGVDYAKWIVEKDLQCNGIFIPEGFDFYVHSQNPVGRDNIEGLMCSYLDYRARVR